MSPGMALAARYQCTCPHTQKIIEYARAYLIESNPYRPESLSDSQPMNSGPTEPPTRLARTPKNPAAVARMWLGTSDCTMAPGGPTITMKSATTTAER